MRADSNDALTTFDSALARPEPPQPTISSDQVGF